MGYLNRLIAAVALAAACLATPAQARVVARVDLSQQRMRVYVNGVHRYTWPVSTARRGYVTPTGRFRPQSMQRFHRSRKYHNSPMPHSIFFRGGYAIHGSYEIRNLGRRASHGCIRLHPANARTLFRLMRTEGPGSIVVHY
jgi:lipoprotein-anchoring transpeptidase ErfK/SrfK